MTDREILEKIVAQMDIGFKDVNGKIDGLQTEMLEGLKEAYTERHEIKMTIENTTNKNINLLIRVSKI